MEVNIVMNIYQSNRRAFLSIYCVFKNIRPKSEYHSMCVLAELRYIPASDLFSKDMLQASYGLECVYLDLHILVTMWRG